MPSLLKYTECRACGRRHHFCLPDGQVAADGEYGYLCPEKAEWTSLRPSEAGVPVQHYPQGAVRLSIPGTTGTWRVDPPAVAAVAAKG